ncbi:MAG: lasso RiPP family leader peptide-containing protein [Trueperaceae bacterium]|nr:lasso RiPP family leader peptide-containing protein [Trueperaceae bacterium]
MNTAKRPYQAPTLQAWGNVVALTQVGQTHPGSDVMNGSVNPPGHGDNGPPGRFK